MYLSKNLKSSVKNVFKGTLYSCVWFCRKKTATVCAIFHTKYVFLSASYFSSEEDPGIVKIVSHIQEGLNYQILVKVVSSDKRQSHIGYRFHQVWWKLTKLTQKFV